MTRAEEAAFSQYPVRESVNKKGTGRYDKNFQRRKAFVKGYSQAEKVTVKRAIKWLKANANKYIVDLTPTYPDAPQELVIGGKCWDELEKAIADIRKEHL